MKAPEHSFSCGVQHNNKIDNCNSLNCNSLNRILCLNLFKIILPKVRLYFHENLQKRKKKQQKGNFLIIGIPSTNGSTGNKVQVLRMKKIRWGWKVYKKTD